MAVPRDWWLAVATVAASLAAFLLAQATIDDDTGALSLAKKVAATAAVAAGLVGTWRLRRRFRLWWIPTVVLLVGIPLLLDVWGDYSGPEVEEECSEEGHVPPALAGAGQWLGQGLAPYLGLAGLAAGIVLLARKEQRSLGAWCLVALAAMLAALWVSLTLCSA